MKNNPKPTALNAQYVTHTVFTTDNGDAAIRITFNVDGVGPLPYLTGAVPTPGSRYALLLESLEVPEREQNDFVPQWLSGVDFLVEITPTNCPITGKTVSVISAVKLAPGALCCWKPQPPKQPRRDLINEEKWAQLRANGFLGAVSPEDEQRVKSIRREIADSMAGTGG